MPTDDPTAFYLGVAALVIFCAIIARALIALADKTPESPPPSDAHMMPPYPRPGTRPGMPGAPLVDLTKVARLQAIQAERNRRLHYSVEGTTLEQWIAAAAHELCRHWISLTMAEAERLMWEHYRECHNDFPNINTDWSLDAARAFAREYANDYGETRGSNG